MVLGDEPGPMGQDLVELVEVSQLGRNGVETLKPPFVAALLDEFRHLLLDQVRALMTASRL